MWQSLRDALAQRLQHASWRPQAEAARVVAKCQEYIATSFPEELRNRVRPIQWKDGVLVLEAAHPAIAQAVYQRTNELQKALAGIVSVRRVQVLIRS